MKGSAVVVGVFLAACGQTATSDLDGGGASQTDAGGDAPSVFCAMYAGPVDSGAELDGDTVYECQPGEVCGDNSIPGCHCCMPGPECGQAFNSGPCQ